MTRPKRMKNLDSFDTARKVVAKMEEDMAVYRKLLEPPSLSSFVQAGKMLEQFRSTHLTMRNFLPPPPPPLKDLVPPVSNVFGASDYLRDVLTMSTVSLDSGVRVHESWRQQIENLTDFSAQLDATVKLSLGENTLRLAATETLLTGIDFDFLKSTFDIPVSTFSAMEQSLSNTAASFRALAESIPDCSALVQMPSFVLPAATFELFTQGYALDVLLPSDHAEETRVETEFSNLAEDYLEALYFVELLERVNPKLVPLYLGARKALYGDDPDRKRHVLISLRELWNWTIRELAPQQEAFNWISEHEIANGLDPKDRPSRIGKVCYISREIKSHPLTNFVVNTAQSSTDLHCLYNRVHELEPSLNERQLRAVFYKTVSELSFLIKISLEAIQHQVPPRG